MIKFNQSIIVLLVLYIFTVRAESLESEECKRLIETFLNNPMCDQFDYYKSSGNGDLNARGGGDLNAQANAIESCRKARECNGVIESKYEESLWTHSPVEASPHLRQEADGKEKGSVVIEINKKIGSELIKQPTETKSNQAGKALGGGMITIANAILDAIARHKDKLNTVFIIKAKQGIFIKTNSNQITFKLRDFLEAKGKIKLNYQTYDCRNEFVSDKEFETFIIETENIKLREFKVPFRCKGPYYTIQTVAEKTETKEPTMKTGGRNLNLKTVTLKETKQVVYIDPIKGKIINAPLPKETSAKKTSEKYKLNTASCQYEIVKKVEKLPYHKSSFAYLNNFSSSSAFSKNTILDLQISSIKGKVIKVPWSALKDGGHFSDSSNWTEKKSEIKKETEVKKLFKVNDKAKISQLKEVSNFGIATEQALGQNAKDTKCRIQREFYDVLENGINMMHPKVTYKYKVNIYQSNKRDIAKAKKIISQMENFSGGYTEEKQIYDMLNNPLYAPKRDSKLVPRKSESKEISADDLEMFTK